MGSLTQARKEFRYLYDFAFVKPIDKHYVNGLYMYYLDGLVKSGFLSQKKYDNASNYYGGLHK